MDTREFSVRLDTHRDTACVHVEGELDLRTAHQLSDCVQLAVATRRVTHLTVDLEQVMFCDSTGLTALIEAKQSCLDRGVGMVLRHPGERLRRTMALTGLADLFEVEPES